MERKCLKTFLHASCLLLLVKCSEQTKKGTVEEFHKVMQQNNATCEKIDTEKTGNVITYQSNEDTGLNDFVQTCRDLNSTVHENDVLTLMIVRKCYKRKDENKKDHIANIIIAMQRYLANPEKQLLHVNNLEVAFHTLGYKDINNFDFAEKNLKNSENNLKEISFMINESVVKFILTSIKSAFADTIAEKLADDKFEVLLRQHSDQKLIMSDVDDFCDSMFEKLTGITYMTDLEDFFLDIDRNEILWRRFMHEIFEKIDRYQIENNFMVIDRENTIVEKKISDKLYEDVKTHLEEVLTLIWPAISDLIKNNGKERFKTGCSFFNCILRDYDLRIFWNRYQKRHVVLDPPRPSIYHYIKSANCTYFAEVFGYYFEQMNFDKLIDEVTPIILANKRDDIESTFFCDEKILILCHGELTDCRMNHLCRALDQSKILESQSIYLSLYFNDQYNLTVPDICGFDRKYCEKRLQQSANQQALFVPGFLGIFHRKVDFEGKMSFVKYTMGNDTVDHDNPITKTSSGDASVCNESLLPMRLLLKDVGPVEFNTLHDLTIMENSIVSIWAKEIGRNHELPKKICRILLPNNEIVLISDKDGNKTSMVYNIPHLHHISQEDQLSKPEEIQDGIWYFEHIPDTFLDNLNSFLQIYFLTGKLCDIRNTYLTFASDYHYAEMSKTYHVSLNQVKSEDRGGMYDYFENAIDKISETPGNHFSWRRLTLDEVKKHSNFGHRKGNQFKFGSYCLVGQDECINDISASFVIEKRHAKGLTYHPAFGWSELIILVRMYMIERNNIEIGAFILRRELKEQIDSSIASLPLLILDKILCSPSNVYQRYFEFLGLGNDKIRFETRLICWIYKFYPIHHCRWDVDDFTNEKHFAKEKVKEMCRDYIQKAVDLETLEKKWFDFTSNEGISQPDDFSIEKCIGKLVDFVFGFIDASHQKKTIRLSVFYKQKPSIGDIDFFKKLKKDFHQKIIE